MDAEKQQAYYELLEEEVGESLAFFYCCIRFDKPFDMKAIPAKSAKEKWTSYCEKLEKRDLLRQRAGASTAFWTA